MFGPLDFYVHVVFLDVPVPKSSFFPLTDCLRLCVCLRYSWFLQLFTLIHDTRLLFLSSWMSVSALRVNVWEAFCITVTHMFASVSPCDRTAGARLNVWCWTYCAVAGAVPLRGCFQQPSSSSSSFFAVIATKHEWLQGEPNSYIFI